ncbi:MAG: ATP-binding cassette domain-containing protein [Candidatus Bathyarchaeota archaeon]|nr:ATP-binding cassette domain-containing protein [Candidatus Bathyarchaeota archaeon]
MAQIEIENLHFTYAGTQSPSLQEINLTIEKGDFIILTGPSGCGKTTLCRCLNGLIPNFYNGDFEGTIEILGMDTSNRPISELARRVGFVFQNPENQLFSLSVERDIAFGPENLGLQREEIKKRVEWALRVTGTEHLRDYAPYELSGGQQQRVAIASVLAMRPEIIVLDEPTSFLDPKASNDLLMTISKLNDKLGITIILVEHRLDLASKYAKRVLIMNEGRILLDGPPTKVYNEDVYLIGVGIPKVSLLFHLLRKDGIEIKKIPVDTSEAVQFLERRMK